MNRFDVDHGDRRRLNDAFSRARMRDDTSGRQSSDGNKLRRRRERPVDNYLSCAGNAGTEQYEPRQTQDTTGIGAQPQRAAARNGITANNHSHTLPSKEDILFDKKSGITRIPAQRQRRHSVQLGGAGSSCRVIPSSSFDRRDIYKEYESTSVDDRPQASAGNTSSFPDRNSAPLPKQKPILDGYASDTDLLYSHRRKAVQTNSTGLAAQPVQIINQDQSKVRNISDRKPMNLTQSQEDILFDKRSGVTRIPAQRQRRHSVQFGESGNTCGATSIKPFQIKNNNSEDCFFKRHFDDTPRPGSKLVGAAARVGTDGYVSDSYLKTSYQSSPVSTPGAVPGRRRVRDYVPEHHLKTNTNVSHRAPIGEDILFDKTSGVLRVPAQRQRRHSVQFGGTGNICSVAGNQSDRGNIAKEFKDIQDRFLQRKTNANVNHRAPTGEDILFDKTSGVLRVPAQRQRRHSVQFGGTGNVYGSVAGNQSDRGNIAKEFKDIQDRFLQRNGRNTAKSVAPGYSPQARTRDGYSSDTDVIYSHLKRAFQANRSFSADKLPRHRARENVPLHHRGSNDTSGSHSQNKEDISFDKSSGVTRVPAQRQRRHSVQFGGSGSTWGTPSLGTFEHSTRSSLRESIAAEMNSLARRPINGYDKANVPLFGKSDWSDGHVSDTDVLYSHIKNKYQGKSAVSNNIRGDNQQRAVGVVKAKLNSTDPVSSVKEDILFDRSSGVTRIPAQRVRRHSVQFGGSGNTCGTVSGNPFNLDHNSAPRDVRRHEGKETSRSNSVGPGPSNNILNIHDGYSSDSEFLRSHLKNVSHRNMGVAEPDVERRSSLGSLDSDVRHGTAIFIRRPSISSLTLEKDSYVRDAEGRAFRKPDTDVQADGTMSDTEAYVKRNIHVRRHSISTPTLRYPFTLREAPAPKILRDFQNWEKPSDIRSRPTASDQGTSTSRSVPFATAGGTNTDYGQIVPVRRHSVTYAPCVDTSDSESPQEIKSKAYLTAPSHSGSQRRTRRRRCRPLSIVKEDISPINGAEDDPDGAILNSVSTNETAVQGPPDVVTTEPQRPTINISGKSGRRNSDTDITIRGENNVNIMATGNVNISVNTTQPMTMVGNNSANTGNFAMWTPRTDLAQIAGYTPGLTGHDPVRVDQSGYPLGMWRQGNVLVDSVRPMANVHASAGGGPVVYPGYPWPQPQYPGPMMLVPCHPQAFYPGNANNTSYPQIESDKSVCAPLTVDTGAAPSGEPAKRPDSFHGRLGKPADPGLLKAANHQHHGTGVQPQGLARSKQNWTESLPQSSVQNGNATPGQCNGHAGQIDANHSEVPATDSQNNNNKDVDSPETEERGNIKDIIANFEERRRSSGGSVSMPQFGTAYKKPAVKLSGDGPHCHTDPGENYELNVENSEAWVTSPEVINSDPTKLHAYIAEMSISEVRYGETGEKDN